MCKRFNRFCNRFSWCKLDKWNRLTNVICLIVEGLSVNDYIQHREEEPLSKIDCILESKLEFLTPLSYDSNVAKELSVLPMTKTRKLKLKEDFGNITKVIEEGEAFHIYR